MRVLHTSDWHIGWTLYGRKRDEEFETFLTWLSGMIHQNEIDALLVAGDVFGGGVGDAHAIMRF